MNIEKIYENFTPGSQGFIQEIINIGGLEISPTEIKRISESARTAEAFKEIWENQDFWKDPE